MLRPKKAILWFHGPAGGGKTCIMREVCTRLQRLGRLAGSYFFSSRVGGLDSERPFVATIAHQLAILCPYFKAELLGAISAHPTVFEESLNSQVEKLIHEPLESSAKLSTDSLGGRWLTIVVDGFDECQNQVERSNLLSILHGLATATRSVRFFLIMASRSELDIRQAFDHQPLEGITHILRLRDYDGTSDVRNFFCDEFCRIRETHPAKAVIPKSWPVEAILNILVDKSSGLYIYPATLIKYIDDPRRSPITLLDEVMALNNPNQPNSDSVNPLAELDSLYHHILHRPWIDLGRTVRLLHYIMVVNQMPSTQSRNNDNLHPVTVAATPCFLDRLLSYSPGETAMGLCDLHSLVHVPSAEETGPVYFFHKTLVDYLASPGRSQRYHRALYLTHAELAEACMTHCETSGNPSSGCDEMFRNVVVYSSVNWFRHIQLAFEDFPAGARGVLPESTRNFDPLNAWKVEVVSSRSLCVWKRRDKIHRTLCKNALCFPICNNSLRLEEIGGKFEKFYNVRLAEARATGTPWAAKKAIKQNQFPENIFLEWFSRFLQEELGDGCLPLDAGPGPGTSSCDTPPPILLTASESRPQTLKMPHGGSPSKPADLKLVLDPPTSVSKPRIFLSNDDLIPSESLKAQHNTPIPLTGPTAQVSIGHCEPIHPAPPSDGLGKRKRDTDDTQEDVSFKKLTRDGDIHGT